MRSFTLFSLSLLLGTAVLLTGGCATRGYVNKKVQELRTEVSGTDQELRASVDDAKTSAESARKSADEAARDLVTVRDLALGGGDLRETGRYEIPFRFNSAEIDRSARSALESAAGAIASRPRDGVVICGMTDRRGPAAYNLELGRRRAEAVLRELAGRSPEKLGRFSVISYGEEPAPGPNGQDLEPDRRVEVILVERVPSGEGQKPVTEIPAPGQVGQTQ